MHGRAAGERLGNDQSERLVPLDRHQERGRVLEERHLGGVVDGADPFDPVAKLRSNARLEELPAAGLVGDVAGDAKRPAEPSGDLDRDVHALVGGEPPEKREITRVGPGRERKPIGVDGVVDRPPGAGVCKVSTLVIAHAYQRERLPAAREQEVDLDGSMGLSNRQISGLFVLSRDSR